jgi:hypothetical protein
MRRLICLSALTVGLFAVSIAQAQTLSIGRGGIQYNGYGQGYYGGYGQGYGGWHGAPRPRAYSAHGNGPYGYGSGNSYQFRNNGGYSRGNGPYYNGYGNSGYHVQPVVRVYPSYGYGVYNSYGNW